MKDSPFGLAGKTALVTGGGSGLGFGISKAFIEANAKVIITGRREDVLKKACCEYPGSMFYVVNDITETETLSGLVNGIEEEHGELDILVNNAGINMKKEVLDVTDEEFEKILKTNLHGTFALAREVGRRMVQRKTGSIINITSMAALYGIPQVTAYTASKTGVLGLTRSLAVDLSPHGIRVNAIAPGFIKTQMLENAFNSDPERRNKVLSRTPLQALGSPEDIAYAAVFLASDASKYITGINLPVDGGNSIGF